MIKLTCKCGCGKNICFENEEEFENRFSMIFNKTQMKFTICVVKEKELKNEQMNIIKNIEEAKKLENKRHPDYAMVKILLHSNPLLRYLTGVHTKQRNHWSKNEIGMTTGYRQKVISESNSMLQRGMWYNLSVLKLAVDDMLRILEEADYQLTQK